MEEQATRLVFPPVAVVQVQLVEMQQAAVTAMAVRVWLAQSLAHQLLALEEAAAVATRQAVAAGQVEAAMVAKKMAPKLKMEPLTLEEVVVEKETQAQMDQALAAPAWSSSDTNFRQRN